MPAPHNPNTAPALEASLEARAGRAVDDPARRAWAARMIRIGLARKLVALSELGVSEAERDAS